MREIAKEFMGLIAECLQKKIKPHIETANKALEKLPLQMKELTKEAISIGMLTAKPIFQLLANLMLAILQKTK